jgi:ribonucleoside-diphosphate reductase alpha chain
MQKYFDQAISGNWSYNPLHYEDNQVPLSVMATDLLQTYKYGWKTSYYQNTYDFKTDDSVEDHDDMHIASDQRGSYKKVIEVIDEDCDACVI